VIPPLEVIAACIPTCLQQQLFRNSLRRQQQPIISVLSSAPLQHAHFRILSWRIHPAIKISLVLA